MDIEIVGEVDNVEIIASGKGVRVRSKLRQRYGGRIWRKLKGIARVRLPSGRIRLAEIHWYEAHGIGKRDVKIKLPFLD